MPEITRMPVVVLFNEPSPRTPVQDRAAEAGVEDAVRSALHALGAAGYAAEPLGVGADWLRVAERLRAQRAVVVNFCEGVRGNAAGEGYLAGLLELLELPYTGSPPDAILLCLNKIRTKRLLEGAGLPTAPYLELDALDVLLEPARLDELFRTRGVAWPVIAKPAAEDASQGILQGSVARDAAELRAAAERVAGLYGFPVLVERFIAGREFNLAVIEDPEPRMLPVSEIVFAATSAGRWPIVTYDAKWLAGSDEDRATVPCCPADLGEASLRRLERIALHAFRVTGCRDYARIDVRTSRDGDPFILEVNANPDLSAQAGLSRQLAAAGMPHDQFLVQLVQRAAARAPHPRLPSPHARSCDL